MNPNTGEILSNARLESLRLTDPERAAGFTVQLDGPAEDIEKIAAHVSAAIKAERRRKNKAARKGRRAAR